MEKTLARVKKWGNSLGIVLPKSLVENQKLKEGVEIEVIIQPKRVTRVKDLFDLSKRLGLDKKLKKTDTQKLHKQMDKELWPEHE